MLDEISRLALETIEKNKQAIIFAPSRLSAEKMAEDIAKFTSFQLPELEKEILQSLSIPTTQCRKLSHCVRKGIAFHHSGLVNNQKELIEEEFRKGTIKIICATPTLAAGVSLPAFRVIIKSLKRYESKWGMDWIPVLEYLQMSGRAGRPEYESFGEAIVLAKDEKEKEEIYDRYICGVPEEIYSKLAVEPVLRTYLLSLISSGIIRDQKTMEEFFSKTFWAHQFQDWEKLQTIMNKMLKLLQEWEFVKIEGEAHQDFVSAIELGKNDQQRLKPTILGKRISELYLDPLTAKYLLKGLQKYDEKKNHFSLLQMISHTLELRPLLNIKVKEQELIQEELNKRINLLLAEEPRVFDLDYDEFMNSIKTALFFEDWIEEKEEDYLLEKYGIRPGEIRVKLEAADWLLYATEELGKLMGSREAIKEIIKLRIRVKNGAKEELLPLLKLRGIGRIRARKMFNQGIKDLNGVKKIDLTSLSQLLGKVLAEDIKKQVGEEIKEVPAGKRKEQLSIEGFD